MKEKRDNRGWAIILILLTLVLNTQAQNLINLEFKDKPLPAALKLIELKEGKEHHLLHDRDGETFRICPYPAEDISRSYRRHFSPTDKAKRTSFGEQGR